MLLADLSPKPDVPDRVRRVPVRAKRRPVVAAAAVGARQEILAPPAPAPAPLGQSRFKVQFTASKELVAKLDKLKALMSHRVPDGDMATIVEEALDALIDQVEKGRFAVRPSRQCKPKSTPKACDGGQPSRHIPNAIKREVYERDEGRCTYTSAEGHRCAERSRLEYHHLKAWGKGGGHSAQNIALVCRTHNRLAADNDFGRGYMNARIRARQVSAASGSKPGPDHRRSDQLLSTLQTTLCLT